MNLVVLLRSARYKVIYIYIYIYILCNTKTTEKRGHSACPESGFKPLISVFESPNPVYTLDDTEIVIVISSIKYKNNPSVHVIY
jgi:hypothetical protein